MAAVGASGLQMATTRPCISSSRICKASPSGLGTNLKSFHVSKLTSSSQFSSIQPLFLSSPSTLLKFDKVVTKAMSGTSEEKANSVLPIDLRGLQSSFYKSFFSFLFFFNFYVVSWFQYTYTCTYLIFLCIDFSFAALVYIFIVSCVLYCCWLLYRHFYAWAIFYSVWDEGAWW